ncbi:FkbM family methyltransferase, partial [bacterium]|nr:FkbM family methyltransferase [bacterium]
ELGAHHPEHGSNTKLLEEHGWTGLSVDPFPQGDWSTRHNLLVQHAVASSPVPAVFVRAGELGGFQGLQAEHIHHQFPDKFAGAQTTIVEPLTPSILLKLYNVPQSIDYLSVDVEGAEYDILSAFPFDTHAVRLITVEHNFTENRDRIRALLESKGFYREREVAWDDFYVSNA